MPVATPATPNGIQTIWKRKSPGSDPKAAQKRRKVDQDLDIQGEILGLEEKILASRSNYNSIQTLLEHIRKSPVSDDNEDVIAAVALCRVFCRLMVAGTLTKLQRSSDTEVTIVQWLRGRLKEYENELLRMLCDENASKSSTALTLLMRLVKEEALHLNKSEEVIWRDGLFQKVIKTLVEQHVASQTRHEYAGKWFEEYADIRYYTFACLADLFSNVQTETVTSYVLSFLSEMATSPDREGRLEGFYIAIPSRRKHDLHFLIAHKKQAQKMWMAILSQNLSKAQRKTILSLMPIQIAPWFLKVELLMDFLTDSFNVAGSTSLMALSGLYYLMQNKNLDYPQFYQKLYSLLDASILHSKHRSRFFRLLDTFLASTHLPAALVASFIKRLSRLTLHAPPSGIVVVVPWIYNILKDHPSCTFMIHRTTELEKHEYGWGDPFRMEEPDPMETDAFESSLWEIHMLQTHYHPNVATIAKIISEQFTKQAYNLEDFFDHSYATMLDAELSKDIRKAPAIEYGIPKKVLMKNDPDSGKEDCLLVKLWAFT